MIDRSRFHFLSLVLLPLILLFSSCAARTLGQSSTASTSTLDVLSAEYDPSTDSIAVKLVNHGQKAITAYGIDISLMSRGIVIQRFGYAADLIGRVLEEQCKSGSGAPWGWEGAIKPGDVYTESLPVGVDKSKAEDQVPVPHIAVTGVLWSDGSVEGSRTAVEGISTMNQIQDQRGKEAKTEAKVTSILQANKGDTDIQHRIGEVNKGVKFLRDITPSVKEPLDGAKTTNATIDTSTSVLTEFLRNLQLLATSPYPEQLLEGYSAFFSCRYEHRLALLQPKH